MRIKARYIFLTILIACYTINLIFLQLIPIAWFDEVMDMLPAARWVLASQHASIAWPMPHCEQLCLVNLPLREAPFLFSTAVFGSHVWATRLPFFIFAVLAIYTFLKLAKQHAISASFAAFAACIVFIDKGFLEMMRGCRPEVLEIALALAVLYFTSKKHYLTAGIISLLSFYLHPATWVFNVVFLVYVFYNSSGKNKLMLAMVGLAFLALFYVYIQQHIQLFFTQYLGSAQMHGNHTIWYLNVFYHFVKRFVFYWKTEPWWLLIYVYLHYLAFFKFKQQNTLQKLLLISVVFTGVYWFFTLTHNYRYTVFLNAIAAAYFVIGKVAPIHGFSKQIKTPVLRFKIYQLLVVVMLAITLLPFIGRIAAVKTQYAQRKPAPVLQWLQQNLPTDNTLLIGESIGAYWNLRNAKTTQFAHRSMAQNAHFAKYKQVFYLSRNANLPIYSCYNLRTEPPVYGVKTKGKTYAGLCLYRITDAATYAKLIQ